MCQLRHCYQSCPSSDVGGRYGVVGDVPLFWGLRNSKQSHGNFAVFQREVSQLRNVRRHHPSHLFTPPQRKWDPTAAPIAKSLGCVVHPRE